MIIHKHSINIEARNIKNKIVHCIGYKLVYLQIWQMCA